MNNCNLHMHRCFKLKIGSELLSFVKKFQSVLKIWTKYRLNFQEVWNISTKWNAHPILFFRLCLNAWTSYVMPLCGTIYNEICR